MACIISFVYALLLGFGVDSFGLDTLGALIFNGMIVNFGILIIKAQNIRKTKKLGISELEYTKIKLLPKIKAKQEKIQSKKKKRA
ncbi:MAG: hypothetical protein MJ219_02530 [Mycoplasmoidaceae bacterium]|nr:hypothetical protein [Mycoplasmoidaceae bacterium]